MTEKKRTPPLGIEPRTWRLTAARSANGALEAWELGKQYAIFLVHFSKDLPSFWPKNCSPSGIWTRVSRVRAVYPDQLDYEGFSMLFLQLSVSLKREARLETLDSGTL